ncbi:hypothetical protein [Pseudonocardia xishanensis]|uniref:Extradiol ring-cleavage dioxygenase class III enzyme subunit B domain-containing protein n=1 Tax=Pseudonocardia xishanensis TaxID=630995 RepID=A0ABP8RUV7_9PSEU
MAEIVVGVACSHSPQLSTPVEIWHDHAARDRRKTDLIGVDGHVHDFAELVPMAPPGLDAELTNEVFVAKDQRMQAGLEKCRLALEESGATVAVVIGNDHKEMFGDDGMPAFAVFLGDSVPDNPIPEPVLAGMPTGLRDAQWAYHGEQVETYPVRADLAWHIAGHLTESDFDPAQLTRQPPGRTLGHAWTYSRRRLMGAVILPMVPIHLNSLYPPTQPSPRRCFALGKAVAEAIRSWESDERVAVITTGGLSHFVVDEELDRAVLDAIAAHDAAALTAIDRRKMNSGTSEILNWVTAAGALDELQMEVIDYVAAYRSEAGTGVGMAFASWH